MSTSICLSVRQDISGTMHTRYLYQFFSVYVAYGRGSVLLRPGDEIRRERAVLGSFLTTVTRSLQMGSAGKRVMEVHSGGQV